MQPGAYFINTFNETFINFDEAPIDAQEIEVNEEQERLVELMRLQAEPPVAMPHVYLVMAGSGTARAGLHLAERLRAELPALRIQSNLGGGSFKAQFKRADRSGAGLALVLGEDELADGAATVKYLRSEAASQQRIALDGLVDWLRDWLNT